MRVAFYQPWIYKKGGAERLILELLRRSEHRLSVFTHYYGQETTFEQFCNYDVRPLSSNLRIRGILTQGINFAKELLKTKINLDEFDVLVISAGAIGGLIALRNHDIPIMGYCQSLLLFDETVRKDYLEQRYGNFLTKSIFSISRGAYHMLERKAWSYMNTVTANSYYIKNLIEKAGLANDVSVLNPGVDTDKYRPTWNYEKYFLVPGWLNQFKRQHLAIEAFKLFAKNDSSFKLCIVGKVLEKDRWYYNKLKQLSEGSENISIVADDRNLLDLYQNAYAVIVPSMGEAWGLVALEAMACGKPVITVNEGGTSEAVTDGSSGFVVSATPAELAEKMRILADDSALHKAMRLAAYKRALQFDWNEFVRKFDHYVSLTGHLDLSGVKNQYNERKVLRVQ